MARLGELERKVMNVLWESEGSPLAVRDVCRYLPHYAYTTVMTVLDRLERKKMVHRTKEGRAYQYVAAGSREGYTAELMHEALGSAPDRNATLIRFAETVSASEAVVLRQALRDLREGAVPHKAHGHRPSRGAEA